MYSGGDGNAGIKLFNGNERGQADIWALHLSSIREKYDTKLHSDADAMQSGI